MGLPIPEEYGGAGGDTVSYAIAIEELTRIDSSVAITVAAHTSLGTMPILRYGTEEQKQRWLPDLASGKRLAAFGLTEAGAGSDVGNTRTTAELRDGYWVINGSKIFITNAGTDITWGVTITARTGEDEISNIVVENGTPGYTISAPMKKLGWRASDTRELSFEDVRVPEENLLGPRGEPGSSSSSRSSTAGGSRSRRWASGSPRARTTSRPRTRRSASSSASRSRRSRPSGSSSPTWRRRSRRAAPWSQGRWLKDQGREFAREAAMAKLYTGELSNRVADAALQIHGGYGYMEESPISRLYRDQKILEIGEGTNEVQRMVIARLLGL